ncbi:MAG TPA: GNAT family N-acetyltransferase [Nitrosopumilaceae archaeon]|nr:GNAT family N-acetyltransferase [Nitrosopumilaceae archaeon]
MTDVTVRQIKEEDLFNGFLESLDSLRKASNIEHEKAKKVFEDIQSNPNHVIFVAIVDNKIVGSTTLLIEPKFIHEGGLVGHIEDVVVAKEKQGLGIGEKLIENSLDYAKKAGCYKTILDCTDDVKPFYEKIGFKRHSNAMRFDH